MPRSIALRRHRDAIERDRTGAVLVHLGLGDNETLPSLDGPAARGGVTAVFDRSPEALATHLGRGRISAARQ